jgi:hypothetical protein
MARSGLRAGLPFHVITLAARGGITYRAQRVHSFAEMAHDLRS